MGRLLLIDRQPRLVDRRLVVADAASCCCPETERYLRLFNCCDLQTYKVISVTAYNVVVDRCPLNDRGFDLILRVQGDPACYRVDLFSISREQAETAGLGIIDDPEQVRCVPTSTAFPSFRCYTETCPPCTTDCCLLGLYRKNCPELIADATLKANVCCNYGRQATRIESYESRTTEEGYTFLNSDGFDAWCPGGCFSEMFTYRRQSQEAGRQTVRYTRCDATGNPVNLVECLDGQHYRASSGIRRRWAFRDPRPTDTNCLQYDDIIDPQPVEENFRGCIGMSNEPPILAPPTFPPRLRYTTAPGPGGTICRTIGEFGTLLCQDLSNHRSSCVVLETGGYREIETTTTTYRFNVSCYQGSSYLEQLIERRAYGAECPVDGSLVARRTIMRRASYSIQTNSRSLCPSNACDGFQREGDVTTGFGLPIAPLPIEGALGLF